jgi:flavin-dependent dehydrogenase
MTLPSASGPQQRTALVEQVAREIQMRGVTEHALLFIQSSMPDGYLAGNAMLFFDPVLRSLFGGDHASASALLADELGLEQLLERLEEIDEESTWDA